MFCSSCGKEIAEDALFCDRCGKPLKADTASQTVNNKQDDFVILARSKSCRNRLEEWRKDANKKITVAVTRITACPFVVIFGVPLYSKIVNNHPYEMPFWSVLLLFVLVIVDIIFASRKNKDITEEYDRVLTHCRVEELVIDREKIYGTTEKGKMTLLFSQIESVTCKSGLLSTIDDSFLTTQEKLTIRDVAGNAFCFYSFENSKELCAIIEDQLQRRGA